MAPALLEGTLGFVGFGTVNSGIAAGLVTSGETVKQLVVHDPNPDRALNRFLEKSSTLTKVVASNQEVVDGADTVFVGVLPQQVEEVLAALKFRSGQLVVSMVSMTTHARLSELVRPAELVRVVPIPPPWKRASTMLVFPEHKPTEELFSLLGKVLVPEAEEQLTKLWSLSALMGPFYAFQRAAVEWAEDNGVDGALAFEYMASIMQSCANDAKLKAHEEPGLAGVDSLVREQTPGGLNEQGVRELTEQGAYAQQKRSLDNVLARLEGREQPHKASRA